MEDPNNTMTASPETAENHPGHQQLMEGVKVLVTTMGAHYAKHDGPCDDEREYLFEHSIHHDLCPMGGLFLEVREDWTVAGYSQGEDLWVHPLEDFRRIPADRIAVDLLSEWAQNDQRTWRERQS